jgi:hypothetical protein
MSTDCRISELENELHKLNKEKEEQAFKTINKTLEEWHQQLIKCSGNKKETSKYQLFILRHPQSKRRPLDFWSPLTFMNQQTCTWDWRVYAKCYNDVDPLVYYANSTEELLPSIEKLVLMTQYGVGIQIVPLFSLSTSVEVNVKIQQITSILNTMKFEHDISWSNVAYTNNGPCNSDEEAHKLALILSKGLTKPDIADYTENVTRVQKCLDILSAPLNTTTTNRPKRSRKQ